MGLLSVGTPLPWAESKRYNNHVRDNGVQQLLHILKAAYKRESDPLLWGDEVEYMMLQIDEYAKDAVLTVDHDKVLKELNTNYKEQCQELNIKFHPEYGRYMVESTPLQPYEGFAVTEVEHNMSARRHLLSMLLEKNGVVCLSSTVFPRMGSEGFTNLTDPWRHKNSVSRSLYLPDEIINRHARFPTLTANIRTRRGEKVCMNIPMYIDDNTPAVDDTVYQRDWFLREDTESIAASRPGHIYLDAMGFGMGCSCLQVTFSAPNIGAARYLYDSLANFAPIMLSLTAAAPFLKGWLSDWDVRWNIISGAVDDRTPFERSTHPTLQYAANHIQDNDLEDEDTSEKIRIPKSRYSTVDLYLGGNKFFRRALNDVPVPVNEGVLDMMQNNDLFKTDEDLARHFAHLFIRDPLVIFSELLDQDNRKEIDHFENIQSTNWQTLRFKPPTQSATPENKAAPGWRVEFRPMEAQLSDFENAAYTIFIYLIVECLLLFRDEINTYIPMSAVWENMELAHGRDSAIGTKFYWKKEFSTEDSYEMGIYSIDEVFHNNENGIFPQFIDRILRHKGYIKKHWTELSHASEDNQETERLYYYLKLISDRAKGVLPTTARYLRDLVLHHPDYKQDSRITKRINFDIIMTSLHLTNLDSCEEIFEFFGPEIGKYLLEHRL